MSDHYNPNQPRVPAGLHEGGRWSRDALGHQRVAKLRAPRTMLPTKLPGETHARGSRELFGQNDPIVQPSSSRSTGIGSSRSPQSATRSGTPAELGHNDATAQNGSSENAAAADEMAFQTRDARLLGHTQNTLSRLWNLLFPGVCRPAPTNLFPFEKCLDYCAMGSPQLMEIFCRTYTQEGTPNRERCWEAANDLRAGNEESCKNRCRAIQENWGK